VKKRRKLEEPVARSVEIRRLFDRRLKTPLIATVEPTAPGFAAHTEGLPVFGYGDDPAEAVQALKEGIEGIYGDEEFLDLRARVQRMLLLQNLAGEEREARNS
jgi:hypothetical protein